MLEYDRALRFDRHPDQAYRSRPAVAACGDASRVGRHEYAT